MRLVRRKRTIPGRDSEQGIVIILVAVFLLFVVTAMAALAIDLVTLYTARSEAQLAADSAALAGARVLANSGATSDPSDLALVANATSLAQTVATQVALQNTVGGRKLKASEVATPVVQGFSVAGGSNPRIKVEITKSDLPAFFSRIWGNTQFAVKAVAVAEAYNPSGLTVSFSNGPRVAPMCVKPWLLPNLDPTTTVPLPLFDAVNGAIMNPSLVGKTWPDTIGANPNPNLVGLQASCANFGDCSVGMSAPTPGQYYPALIDALDPMGFPPPTQSLPVGSAGFNAYQLSIAGCVPTPINCGSNATFKIDTNAYAAKNANRDADTVEAVADLTHSINGLGDKIDTAVSPNPPFQFLAGQENPIVNARGSDILVSNSLVTIPVFDSSGGAASPVNVIGFLQVFLNPPGTTIAGPDIPVEIVNMAGCGSTATGQPILGNGGSPVPVRLISQ